jgi:hypothetical protein
MLEDCGFCFTPPSLVALLMPRPMKIQPFIRFRLLVFLAVALFNQSYSSPAQTAEGAGAASAGETAKRLEWLKSFGANVSPQPTPAAPKKRFAETRSLGIRFNDSSSARASAPDKPSAENSTSTSPAIVLHIAETHASEPAPTSPRPVETKGPSAHSATAATTGGAPPGKPADSVHHDGGVASTKRASESRASELHMAATPSPKPSPSATHAETVATVKRSPEPHLAELHAATPSPRPSPLAARAETVASAKRLLEPHIAELHVTATPSPNLRLSNMRLETVAGRYPWKTGIVTTVFWIGEPVGGNNFTPNCSSSWDANWTRSYGGYDNPHPEARRNFMPVNFTPRQNPFYVALPYNDVTRGTTKPEARLVIPWFREAFRKEGQSVCRDRWVAVRNREGRVAYAQWSDCGPFRTDHWQYVFGMERPRPNLNQGAGLDVSPATRDYLGLQSTDVTDWKFMEARDVPIGPWSLCGENNPFVQRRGRANQAGSNPTGPAAIEVAVNRARSL